MARNTQDQRRSVVYAQNFIHSRRLAARLVERSSVTSDDTVVEIGPGKGILTRASARQCHHVIAVEKDPKLARQLGHDLSGSNVTIFEADVLSVPLPATRYKVFANIPFNITSDIVTRLTQSMNPPDDAYLVMQREAGERFVGFPRQSLYALLLDPWFVRSIDYRFKRTDFVPIPRVDVVLLRFSKRGPPLVRPSEAQSYRDFVVHGFTAWQPTLRDAYCLVFSPHQLNDVGCRVNLD